MANMKEVNKALKAKYPHLDIQAFRGDCYVYFNLGVHDVDSLYVHPVTTPTESLIQFTLEHIHDFMTEHHLI